MEVINQTHGQWQKLVSKSVECKSICWYLSDLEKCGCKRSVKLLLLNNNRELLKIAADTSFQRQHNGCWKPFQDHGRRRSGRRWRGNNSKRWIDFILLSLQVPPPGDAEAVDQEGETRDSFSTFRFKSRYLHAAAVITKLFSWRQRYITYFI